VRDRGDQEQGQVECIVCGSCDWREQWPGSGPSLWRCATCGFVRAELRSSFDVSSLYGEDYNYGCLDGSALIPEARHPNPAFTARRRYWLSLLASEVGGPSRLLDIGCGAGALLDVAKREGWDGIGQEISSVAAAEARARGHPVVVGELSEELFAASSFDAATMIEVIEHIPDPRPTLTAARTLIRGGGALLLTTGDIGSARARLRRRRWGYVRPPLHVSYFRRETIEQLLLSCGFAQVVLAPTFNLAFPSLPILGAPSRPFLQRSARMVRRVTRSEMCVLARV
jgi:SAM-dependent methyltransferase